MFVCSLAWIKWIFISVFVLFAWNSKFIAGGKQHALWNEPSEPATTQRVPNIHGVWNTLGSHCMAFGTRWVVIVQNVAGSLGKN